jgi:hypothetical protein
MSALGQFFGDGKWTRDPTRDIWIAPNGQRFTSQQIAKARESPAAFVAMFQADLPPTSKPEPKRETSKRRLYTKE